MMSAASVLEVGCGIGALLRRARKSGHHGRLCGLDPAAAMLDVGRARADIEWVQGDLASCSLPGRFDLLVMTGYAFQVLLTDDDIEAALAAMRSCLEGERDEPALLRRRAVDRAPRRGGSGRRTPIRRLDRQPLTDDSPEIITIAASAPITS